VTDSQAEWKRTTALRKVTDEQAAENPPPLPHSIAAAARYVGASAGEVEGWWQRRGR
jgi:hypothetical protein